MDSACTHFFHLRRRSTASVRNQKITMNDKVNDADLEQSRREDCHVRISASSLYEMVCTPTETDGGDANGHYAARASHKALESITKSNADIGCVCEYNRISRVCIIRDVRDANRHEGSTTSTGTAVDGNCHCDQDVLWGLPIRCTVDQRSMSASRRTEYDIHVGE